MLPVVFPDTGTIGLFCLTALALLVIPGPAVLYVVTQGAEQGRRVGLASVAGIHLGTLVHIAAATVGLSALIVASAVAFSAVKYAGAVYLIYLGVRKLVGRDDVVAEPGRERVSYRRAFARGALVNVLNPKTALVSDSLYDLAAGTVGGVLRRRRRAMRYGSGVVFIGLGAVAALAKR
jgi:threonine/homoserine/homoserine lactone efflux protein